MFFEGFLGLGRTNKSSDLTKTAKAKEQVRSRKKLNQRLHFAGFKA